ncbi:MAG: hypothetical protein E7541_01070 [Ruminococcaceae bacterium]|nr:hypothetical protein [Oscillospiraceae bacterium]
MRLRYALMRFMAGRYGNDTLNTVLLVIYLVIWMAGVLVGGRVGLLLNSLSLGAVLWAFYRSLSRDIPRRQAENAAWLRFWSRIRDVRRYRYRRCPRCRAQLRLPVKRGRRTVTCGRCRHEFKAFFW